MALAECHVIGSRRCGHLSTHACWVPTTGSAEGPCRGVWQAGDTDPHKVACLQGEASQQHVSEATSQVQVRWISKGWKDQGKTENATEEARGRWGGLQMRAGSSAEAQSRGLLPAQSGDVSRLTGRGERACMHKCSEKWATWWRWAHRGNMATVSAVLTWVWIH